MTHPRFWLTRLYVCTSVLVTAAMGAAEPAHKVLNPDTFGGISAIMCLVAFGLAGLLDTIGHDLMGRRECTFTKLRRYRFFWLMGLATGLTALLLPAARWGAPEPTLARYALDAVAALVLAALDIQTRRAVP